MIKILQIMWPQVKCWSPDSWTYCSHAQDLEHSRDSSSPCGTNPFSPHHPERQQEGGASHRTRETHWSPIGSFLHRIPEIRQPLFPMKGSFHPLTHWLRTTGTEHGWKKLQTAHVIRKTSPVHGRTGLTLLKGPNFPGGSTDSMHLLQRFAGIEQTFLKLVWNHREEKHLHRLN